MSCNAFRRNVHHFQADELPEGERLRLQEHLDGCPDCARFLEVEDGFLQALRSRIRPAVAPPGLETRIRARLEDAAPPTGGLAWYRRAWLAPLAASVLLAALLLPGLGDSLDTVSLPGVVVERQEGTVVDHDCDRMGRTPAEQRKCRLLSHMNVLKVGKGRYWRLNLDDDATRTRLADPTMRGHRLIVAGQLYPAIHTLHMDNFEDLGLPPAG